MANRDSDQVPALGALANKVAAKTTATPELEAERPRAPTTLGALEVKVELGVSPPRRSEASEDAATGDFAPAFSTEEVKATALYAPAVSTLIGRLEEPEVAPEVNPHLVRMRLQLPHLKAVHSDLKAHFDPEDGLQGPILARAKAAVEETSALIEALPREGAEGAPTSPSEHEELEREKQLLHTANFALEELITSCRPAPTPPPPVPAPVRELREATAPGAMPASTAELLDEERQGRRRLIMLGVLVGLLAAGRVGLFLSEGHKGVAAVLEEKQESGAVQTTNRSAGATADQLAAGIPSVLELRLEQARDGSLRARAVAIDPDGDRISISYRWLENDQQVELEGRGVLGAYRVRPGSKYRVEARASDGKRDGEPVLSPVLVAGGARP